MVLLTNLRKLLVVVFAGIALTACATQGKKRTNIAGDVYSGSDTVEYLEKSKDLKSKIGNAARNKVIAEHPLKDFISKWTNVFTMIKASFYIPSV